MNGLRGFTLIELLVVIAIIGILSAVVLASLGTARLKGQDAAIKKSLSGAKAQAELFYYSNGNSYANVCAAAPAGTTKSVYAQINGAASAQGLNGFNRNTSGSSVSVAVCNDSSSAWAAEVPLKTPAGFFCVDGTGITATSSTSKLTSGADVACA